MSGECFRCSDVLTGGSMNILFVVNTLGFGGAEKIFMDLIKNFDCEKHKLTVLMIDKYGVYAEQIPDYITKKCVFQHESSPWWKKKWYGVIGVAGRNLLRKGHAEYFYKRYVKEKYDVEIAFLEGDATYFTAQSTNPMSVKYAWVHTDMIKNPWSEECFPNKAEECKSYAAYDRVLAVSQSVKDAFEKKFDLQAQVIYNALDEKEVFRKAEEFICEKEKKEALRFVTVGRLVEVKGYDRLIKVFAKLYQKHKDIELVIVGDGPEREKLEKLIMDNHLSDVVFLYGYKENPYPYIKSSDVFICSSYAEGFSTVVTEALILGVPTVTTDCAGMRELLGDSHYGLIVKNSEEGLLEGITQMIEQEEVRKMYAEKALERGKKFCVRDRIQEIEEMINADYQKKIRENK